MADPKDEIQANENTVATVPEAESAETAAEVLADAPEVPAEAAPDKAEPSPSEEAPVKEEKAEEPKKPTKAVSKDLEAIIEKIEKLSVLELADLVHALEERFGVTAAAPMAVAGGATPTAGGEAPAEEQTTFNVILANAGANKIGVIKAVRELVPTLGLKEAKDLVEAAPKPVLEGVNKEAANEAKTKLTAAGATVELQ